MRPEIFPRLKTLTSAAALVLLGSALQAAPKHGIAMYGEPALPADYQSLPYVNADAPKGGSFIEGNTGGFDSLNPFVRKGTVPWQLRFFISESLMGRSWDEPFTLYGLLAESIEVPEDRSWVEFTLRPEAKFSDGSPLTVEDVIWSYETLGTEGHPRYHGFWKKIDKIEQTGDRSVRITFNVEDRELALIAGLRPILKKAQWQDMALTEGSLQDVPITSAPYVVSDYEAGRYVSLKRNPDYWGKDLAFRQGTGNFDELRIEFYGDQSVLFEAFKAGEMNFYREGNAEKWASQYDFPAVSDGDVLKSEIKHQRPTGMVGYVMNSRRPVFEDWRVRQAMITAFNFPYVNGTVTGGRQNRIQSYFSNSHLGLQEGPATGKVLEILQPFTADLLPGTIEGLTLPEGDDSPRNRADTRAALKLLEEAGWTVKDGTLVNADGAPFTFEVVIRQGDKEAQSIMEIYREGLTRLGITMQIAQVDNAQFAERRDKQDFDMMPYVRYLSLSPGNEQNLYWGSAQADIEGSRNLMGMKSAAVDATIQAMLTATSSEDFTAATRALDRQLMAGRYVIPLWAGGPARIAHRKTLQFPQNTPIYGDRIGYTPDVWWSEE